MYQSVHSEQGYQGKLCPPCEQTLVTEKGKMVCMEKGKIGVHADDMTYACGAQQAHIWYIGEMAMTTTTAQ